MLRPPGPMLDGSVGTVIDSGASETASRQTVTGWSRPLVTVAANRPLALERVTAAGRLDPDRAQLRGRGRRGVRSVAARRRVGVRRGRRTTRRPAPGRRPPRRRRSLSREHVLQASRRPGSATCAEAKLAASSSRRGLAPAGRSAGRPGPGRRGRCARSSTVVRCSQPTSRPSKKPVVLGRGPVCGSDHGELLRARGAAAGRAASARIRWRTATGASGSSGPGPPLAAPEEVATSRGPAVRDQRRAAGAAASGR